MIILDAVEMMDRGYHVRRPHWPSGTHLMQEEWNGINVACKVELDKKEMYNFPLVDVIADDWMKQ
jgi:hypothetical protein